MKNFWKSLQIHPTLNDEANRVYRNFNYLLLIGIADVAFLCVFFRNIHPNWPFVICTISLVIISMASLLANQYFFTVLKPSIQLEGDGVYYWNIFLTGAIIFLTLYFFKTGYEKKHAQLTRQNEAIHNQKEEIEQINEVLESILNNNTERLRTQEERINEYAHIHAHQ